MTEYIPPPWIFDPELPRGSIGWRMGGGQDDLAKWQKMFIALSPLLKKEYMEKYPAPAEWESMYQYLIDHF
jgi:hypothetical protein